MAGEGGGGGVGLATLLTLKGFLPTVRPPVNLQIVQLGKRCLALLARVRLGSAMSQHVPLQVAGGCEGRPTLLAQVRAQA